MEVCTCTSAVVGTIGEVVLHKCSWVLFFLYVCGQIFACLPHFSPSHLQWHPTLYPPITAFKYVDNCVDKDEAHISMKVTNDADAL